MVQGTGDSPGVDCSYLFRGEVNDNCNGLCYNMKAGSFFRDENVTLTVVSGSKTVVSHPVTHLDMPCGSFYESISNFRRF